MECPVDAVIWIITGACNLDCIHCYAYRWRGKPELSLEEKLRIAREIGECGIDYVNISGGEPLITWHTRRVIDVLRDYNVEVTLVSNGTLVTRDWAEYLAKRDVHVFISVDGPREVHDAHRGRGSFDATMRGVRLLREAGVGFSFVMAVSRLNWRYTPDFVELAVKMGAEKPILIPTMPFGKALENNVYVGAREYNEAVRRAAEKAAELGVRLHLWCSPFAYIALPPHLHPYVVVGFCRSAPVVDIDPQGRILLCDVMDIVIGSVVGKSLREAIIEAESHPLVREIFSPSKLPEACSTCPLRYSCMGGCFARAMVLRGGLNNGDPLCPRIASSSASVKP